MSVWLNSASLSAAGAVWLPILLDATVKGSPILIVAAIATLAMRRASASARFGVWFLAIVGMLFLPALSAIIPGWHVLPRWAAFRPELASPPVETELFTHPTFGVVPSTPTEIPVPPLPTDSPVVVDLPPARVESAAQTPVARTRSLLQETAFAPPEALHGTGRVRLAGILIVWAVGAVLAIGWWCVGWLSVWRLGRTARPINDVEWSALLQDLAARIGLERSVRLLQSRHRVMPMTWGVWRPKLLLPDEATTWPVGRRRAVLLHELAHLKRRDPEARFLTQIACAVYWFNPLVWIASRRMAMERERACDDLVLTAGSTAADYAEHLVQITSRLRVGRLSRGAAIAMARTSGLEERLLAILDDTRDRRVLTRAGFALAAVLLAAAVLPVAMLRVADADDRASEVVSEADEPVETVTVSGFVADRHGHPRANVSIGPSFPRGLSRAAQTGREGRFILENVRPEQTRWVAHSSATRTMALFTRPRGADEKPIAVRLDLIAGELDGRVVDRQGRGLEDRQVRVRVKTRVGEAFVSDAIKTDDDGYYDLSRLPMGGGLTLEVGLVPETGGDPTWMHRTVFRADQSAVELPDLVDPAAEPQGGVVPPPARVRYGGRMVDEDGAPIEGVEVRLSWSIQRGAMTMGDGRRATTDANGQWSRRLPRDPKRLRLMPFHPDYISGHAHVREFRSPAVARLREGKAVVTMKRGHALRGLVRSASGSPIADALILTKGSHSTTGGLGEPIEDSTMTRSDRAGRFRIGGVPTGECDLVVYATGYGPRAILLTVGSDTAPVELELNDGGTIRGQIIDSDGEPVEDARVNARGWEVRPRKRYPLPRQTLTDREGRFELHDLPTDGHFSVYYGKRKAGYLTVRAPGVEPREEPYSLTIYKPTVIEGRVVDDTTGEPITDFEIIEGIQSIVRGFESEYAGKLTFDRRRSATIKSADGSFRRELRNFIATPPYPAFAVLVTAPGYLPAETPAVKIGEKIEPITLRLRRKDNGDGAVPAPRPGNEPRSGAKADAARVGAIAGSARPPVPADRATRLTARSFEGRFELHRPIPLQLAAGTVAHPRSAEVKWIRFETIFGNSYGVTARVGWSTTAETAWRIRVELLDTTGRTLAHPRDRATAFVGMKGPTTQGRVRYVDLTLSPMHYRRGGIANRFRIHLEAAALADDHGSGGRALDVRVVHNATRQPVADAVISVATADTATRFPAATTFYVADAEGRCRVELPSTELSKVTLAVQKDGLASVQQVWSNNRSVITNLPERHTVALSPVLAIGGVVEDEKGGRIVGAEIKLHGQAERIGGSVWISRSLQTDAEGRWRLDAAPRDFDYLSLWVKHPGYASDYAYSRGIAEAEIGPAQDLTLSYRC